MLSRLYTVWHHIPCIYAAVTGTLLSIPVVLATDGDWLTRLSMMFGAGGIAAIIIAFTRFKVAGSVVRKTDAETLSGQFVLIVERLQQIIERSQQENKALSNRLEAATQREALITVSKHDALKENQAMIFHIQNLEEKMNIHNANPAGSPPVIIFKPFCFTPLKAILEKEDTARTAFADSIQPVIS